MFKTFKVKLLKALIPFTVIATLMGILFTNTHGASVPLILKAGLTNTDVNVFSAASQDTSVLTSLSSGTYITLRSNISNGWYYVMYGDNLSGYVLADYINEVKSEVKVVKGDASVRIGPSESYKSVGELKRDEIFLSLGKESNGWYKILYDGINVCYISGTYVDSSNGENIASINVTSINVTSINTTSIDTTSIDTTSADVTDSNSTYINTTSSETGEILPQSISTVISYDLMTGYYLKLPITLTPSDVTNRDVTFTSNNPEVAGIVNGEVSAKSEGVAKITATTVNGLSAVCIIRVFDDGGESIGAVDKAVRRAYDYLDLFGANSSNPAIPNNGALRVYLDEAYTDNKRYTNCAEFVWYCYRAAGVFLEDKAEDVAEVETMVSNPGSNFENLGYLDSQDLEVGDVLTWLSYYGQGMGHAAIYVGDNFVIDMSPNGIQRRTIDIVNSESYSKQQLNVIRYLK